LHHAPGTTAVAIPVAITVDVACVATHGGEVVSVTFPDGEYPNAVADK
jgi:hypothetical protein